MLAIVGNLLQRLINKIVPIICWRSFHELAFSIYKGLNMMNKNVVIPIVLIFTVAWIEILLNGIPLSIGVWLLILCIPVILIQQKSNNDWGMMLIGGIGIAVVMTIVLTLLFYASNQISWLKYLLLWPYN